MQPRIDQCKMENQKGSVHVKPLSLTDLSSAFVILGLGFSFAFLVFLIERVLRVANTEHQDSRNKTVLIVAPKNITLSNNSHPTTGIPALTKLRPSEHQSLVDPNLNNVPESEIEPAVVATNAIMNNTAVGPTKTIETIEKAIKQNRV